MRRRIINNRTRPQTALQAETRKKSFVKEAQSAFENPKAVLNYNNSRLIAFSEQS
jgi:hypothetical protein